MKKTIILTAILFAISTLDVSAKAPNEVSIWGGAGYSFFHFKPTVSGASSKGYSGDLGIGFTGFITNNLGFHIGAGVALYSLTGKKDSLNVFSSGLTDSNGYTFDLYSELTGYSETHKLLCISVPLMIQFQTEPRPAYSRRMALENCFYAMAGVKVNIVFDNQYETKVATLHNKAYYPKLDNWAGTQKFAGLGAFNGNNADGNLKYVLPIFTLEAGMKWRIAKNMFLYTGAYFDYALNSFTKNERDNIENYTSPTEFDNLSLLAFTEDMNVTTVGIKLRLSFVQKYNPVACPAIQQKYRNF
jgi:hypothetical protein